MNMLAYYVPKPQELTNSILLIGFAYVILCIFAARLRLSPGIAAAALALGCVLALAPDLIAESRKNLGTYGDTARKWSETNHSDAFFAITIYMCVGRGQIVALFGMLAGLLLHAGVSRVWQWKNHTATAGVEPLRGEPTSPRTHAFTLLSVAALCMLASYIAGYYATVDKRRITVWDHTVSSSVFYMAPVYSNSSEFNSNLDGAFQPIHAIDRKLRPRHWAVQ